MTLPAFASIDDLEAHMGPVADVTRAEAALERASTLIRVEAGTSWVVDAAVDFGTLADYQQDAVVSVCLSAAARSLTNPEGVQSETESVGDASLARTYADTSSDVYLTRAEKRVIHQIVGKGGLWVQPTSRGDRLETGPLHDVVEDTTDPIDVLAAAQVDVRH